MKVVDILMKISVDSYYRTFEGFYYLIQREWCSMGHNFAIRQGICNFALIFLIFFQIKKRTKRPLFFYNSLTACINQCIRTWNCSSIALYSYAKQLTSLIRIYLGISLIITRWYGIMLTTILLVLGQRKVQFKGKIIFNLELLSY